MVLIEAFFISLMLLLVTGIHNDSLPHGWTPALTQVMQISSNQNFSIVMFLPIHKQGITAFDCGSVSDDDVLSQLIAVNYALNMTNEEAVFRTGITLGAYIIDDCSQPLRAVQVLYQLLAGNEKANNKTIINPGSMVAVITTEAAVEKAIADLLSSFQIPLITAFLKPEWETSPSSSKSIQLIPDSTQWLDAVVSFLKDAKVEFVSLISVSTYGHNSRNYLSDKLKDIDVCIISNYDLSPESEFKSLAHTIVSSSEGHIILFLSNHQQLTFDFLKTYTSIAPASKHIFVISDQLLSKKSVHELNTNILLVGSAPQMQYYDLENYVEKVNVRDHYPINDEWFEQLWQQHFHCSLYPTHSRPLCTGHEKLDAHFTFFTSADYLSLAVRIAALGFQNFLTRHCQEHDQMSNIQECGPEARSFLLLETRKAWSGDKQRGQQPLVTSNLQGITFQLHYRNDFLENSLKKIAEWNNGTLIFEDGIQPEIGILGSAGFACVNSCAQFCPEKAAKIMASNLDFSRNLRETWGIVTSSLSVTGMFVVMGCASYLIVVVPSSKGTMVLNYVILFGIFALFGCNFSFIILASKVICTVRRFVMGVAYAIIFSAKLMKVLNIWRTAHHQSPSLRSCNVIHQMQDDAKSSFILFVSLAISFFQGGIATAWIILAPSEVVYDTLHPLCSPGLMFEEGLILSLFYVMVLIVVTFILATITWKYETNHRESRWIFASTVLVCFIWLLWTLIATQSDIESRSMAIVIGNLLCSSVIFMCLFVPKLYLYNKLLKQAKKLDIRAFYPHNHHSRQTVPSLYDPLHHGSVNSSYSSITGTLTTTANSERKLKKSLSFNKHQLVRSHQKYPRPVYDGRSQFSVEQRSSYHPPRLNAIHDLPPSRAMHNHLDVDCI